MINKINKITRLTVLACCCFVFSATAQTENSPYSRYGLGDVVPGQNILNRAMGGITAAYYDVNSLNFVNPASYARLRATTLDLGVELTNRSLRSTNPPQKFNSYSPNISYVQLGFPLKKNGGWGMALGLRPITRINYKISNTTQLFGPDFSDTLNVGDLFEGNGGAFAANVGTGFVLFKDFTVGVNVGYLFGSKDYSSRRTILNDTILYHRSNQQVKTNYGGLLLNGGIQYKVVLNKTSWLRFGAYASLQQKYNATRDHIAETFQYDADGATQTIDSVYRLDDQSGKITYPASFGVGIIYDKLGRFLIGADYAVEKWAEYRYYGDKDQVQDSWEVRLGGQLLPAGGKTYWTNVGYRAGFNFGKDYISADGNLRKWGVSTGIALPMRKPNYTNQFSVINLTLEYGQRGNNENLIRENYFRIAVGLSLSDIWFMKRQYD